MKSTTRRLPAATLCLLLTISAQARQLNLALLDDNEYRASSVYPKSPGRDYPISGAFDGDRKGLGWGAGGGWNDATRDVWPDWLEVKFKTPKVVKKVVLAGVQYGFGDPQEPTLGMQYCYSHGFSSYEIQVSDDGVNYTKVADVTHDYECLHVVELETEVRALYVRAVVRDGIDHYSRIVEMEVYGPPHPAAMAKAALSVFAE